MYQNYPLALRARRALSIFKDIPLRTRRGAITVTKSMVIASFWFSKEHLSIVIAPFWLSTDDIPFLIVISY